MPVGPTSQAQKKAEKQQFPSGKLVEAEAGAVGGMGRPLSSDTEATMTDTASHVASEEEDILLAISSEEAAAGAGPSSSVLVEAKTSRTAGTSTGTSRNVSLRLVPHHLRRKAKRRQAPHLGKPFARRRGIIFLDWCLLKATHTLCLKSHS